MGENVKKSASQSSMSDFDAAFKNTNVKNNQLVNSIQNYSTAPLYTLPQYRQHSHIEPDWYATAIVGTPEFMAPEVYEESYGTAVDIWAFGMTFLELVTRESPYAECVNVGDVYRKVANGTLPAVIDKILDEQVVEIIHRCLKMDPLDRPTADDLLLEFETVAFQNEVCLVDHSMLDPSMKAPRNGRKASNLKSHQRMGVSGARHQPRIGGNMRQSNIGLERIDHFRRATKNTFETPRGHHTLVARGQSVDSPSRGRRDSTTQTKM